MTHLSINLAKYIQYLYEEATNSDEQNQRTNK